MTRPLVLSLNPALDVEWRVDAVRWEEKNSILAETRWAGGKGVNVARWLRCLGGKPQLLVPLGGQNGRELAQCLRRGRLPARIVRLREPTRANVLITAPDGRQMRFNQPGPRFSQHEAGKVLHAVRQNLAHGNLLVLSGSLPRGLAVNTYARLIRLAHRRGVTTLLDCDGPAFAAAVKERPFLVKPNEHELAQWRDQTLRTEADVVHAGQALSKATQGWVLISRGAKAGLLVNTIKGVCLRASPPRLTPRTRLGAGDALLAAASRQIELGAPPEAWLRHGVATGALATQSTTGALPEPVLLTGFLRRVRIA